MDHSELSLELHGMDLSLLDQLLKGRFKTGSKILDAGFGGGRNCFYFINNGFNVYGIDHKETAVSRLHQKLAQQSENTANFKLGNLENIPFNNKEFDIIICNAVLHFATSLDHFHSMFSQLVRVLNDNGVLFIRMTSDIGIASKLSAGNNGVFLLPDGSHRFLLTRSLLKELITTHKLAFVEPLKTVNVNDVRCMSTLVLSKSLNFI